VGLLVSRQGVLRQDSSASNFQPMSKVALVVDDSMLIRYSICRFLEARGFAVEAAVNGAEAVELLARVRADLIVTDMRMPKMSGSEFISALKSKDETSGVPIIVVTSKANGSSEPDERADFVIYKDIDVETQLDAALETVMGNKSRGQANGS
jgi:CheY-like chemotaxis protein